MTCIFRILLGGGLILAQVFKNDGILDNEFLNRTGYTNKGSSLRSRSFVADANF